MGGDDPRPRNENRPAAPGVRRRRPARLRSRGGAVLRPSRGGLSPVVVLAAALIACGVGNDVGASRQKPLAFDAGRAFEHIRQLVAIGPRPPGSPGSRQAREYIISTLKRAGLAPSEQTFTASTPLGPVEMTNVTARIPGRSADRLLLGGHYDTKLYRQFRFVGANDGGSSTAMLLELGRVLAGRRGPLTLELVFFDGEEAMLPTWAGDDNTYGSRHYVAAARRDGTLETIKGLILLDMVGDRHLTLRRESYSTPWMTDIVWASARRLGFAREFLDEPFAVEDDHRHFLDAGIPAVNIIDLEYAPWHTADDTLEHVSARSLQIVGDVVLDALPAIEQRLTAGR